VVFLPDMPLEDYLKLSNHNKSPPSPDHWFVLSGIHWCENPEHQLIAEIPSPTSLNQTWENKMELDNQTRKERGEPPTSREVMLPYFRKYEEETRLYPI